MVDSCPALLDSLEKLDLLLIHEVGTRKVRTDGIHFHNFRYLSLTLAAYVGEEVTLRFDARDVGEIRVFYSDRSFAALFRLIWPGKRYRFARL